MAGRITKSEQQLRPDPKFHDKVLENGTIPLGYLRQHIEAWIASKSD